jgi:type I restriction enzyme M protein
VDIEKHNFVLTPGRYVGIPDEVEDDMSFENRMVGLTMRLGEQMREVQGLDDEIKRQLAKVGFSIDDVTTKGVK